jgi:hypothetical protein
MRMHMHMYMYIYLFTYLSAKRRKVPDMYMIHMHTSMYYVSTFTYAYVHVHTSVYLHVHLHTCQLTLRKVPGAGYTTSNVEGLRAKALLAQAKATAKKGVGDLEAASAAHLQLESKSAQLHKAIERY